jgi:ubiquinone/menaquinone biosynthesis C-methylase UbiE
VRDANQKVVWDEETKKENYSALHVDALKRLNISGMLDAGVRAAAVDLSQVSRVLEIGGGSQYLSRHLLDRQPKLKVTCTDISEERVHSFSDFWGTPPSNLTTQGHVDAHHLPYEDSSFDLIIGDAVLHHIEILKNALFEINRCLTPNGVAIFVREPSIGEVGVQVYRVLQWMGKEKPHVEKNRYEYKKTIS